VRRRAAITLLGGAAGACAARRLSPALAQSRRPVRIGIASAGQTREAPLYVAFEERLRELGYVDGAAIDIDFIALAGRLDRLPDAMAELVRRGADILVAGGPEATLRAARAATTTIPIVMGAIDYDPIARGYIPNLRRPGGNITGVVFQQIELSVKRLELWSEAFPETRAASVLWDEISADQWRATEAAAGERRLSVAGLRFGALPYDYERALDEAPPDHRSLLLVLSSTVFFGDRARIAEIALRRRARSLFVMREWVAAGGLMSYGPSLATAFRRMADQVDRIIRGTPAGELPLEQPREFHLVVNTRTAAALGITLPPALLARADEVIE
jgi:putative ABC transport system substrate-binding protein